MSSSESKDGERLPETTAYHLLSRAAAENGARTAITFIEDADKRSQQSITHGEFISRIHQFSHLLVALGVGRTDVISLLCPTVTDSIIAFFSAETVGIVNPINFLLRTDDLVAMMTAVRTKVLVTMGPDTPDIWSKAIHIKAHVPSLKHIVTIGAAGDDVISLERALRERPKSAPSPSLLPRGTDIAAYFHTGGTTGSPKLAMHSHANQSFTAEALADSWKFDAETRVLNGMPIFHVAGSLLLGLSPLSRGGEIILPTVTGLRNQRVVANYWRIVESTKATIGGGIPTTLASLLEVPIGDANVSSLKYLMTGGTYMPPAIARGIKERFGLDTRQLYGMTETAGLIAASHNTSAVDPHSIGEVINGAEVEVRELMAKGEVGGPVDVGKTGVIVTRGPQVFPGYFSGQLSPLTADGWLVTGDIGFINPAGRIVVTGRAKDVIIRSGHNIDPAVIEEAAGKHPSVGIAAAVGMPDAYAGEVPVVYLTVVKAADASANELMAHLSDTVPEPPARPRHVFILTEMPTTTVGKIDKVALRRDATRRSIEAVLSSASLLVDEHVSVDVCEGEGGRLLVTVRTSLKQISLADAKSSVGMVLDRFSFAHEVLERSLPDGSSS